MPRALVLSCVAIGLCGCVTNLSARVDDNVPLTALAKEQNGVVLFHTSLHDEPCQSIMGTLAKPSTDGRYVQTGEVTLRGLVDANKVPSQLVLPAGTYGIVGLSCQAPYRNRSYFARFAKRGSILDGSGAIFERPIATFSVNPGEVVDIGSLSLPSRGSTREFIGVVGPIPEPYLRNLAETKPSLFKARVLRLMTLPERRSSEGLR